MATKKVTIELRPLGKRFTVDRGTPLQDVLFPHGVEFPCGGKGRCKGCRIKLLEGNLPLTGEERDILSAKEIAEGWRLACRANAEEDIVIHLAQWEAAILGDETTFAFQPRAGLGVAVDLGTTTLVAQLIDLQSGHVLAVRTALNPQARHGGDVMSRVEFAVTSKGGAKLRDLIRRQIGRLIAELIKAAEAEAARIVSCVVVGNTVMHHLFCGLDLEPLSHYPFESPNLGLQTFGGAALGWKWASPDMAVEFLPCLGGFVGSDVLAGLLATGVHQRAEMNVLVDIGTNGEIVVGNRERMICAATAAGPAFEGARISRGMRAATGAIAEVHLDHGAMQCRVLGNVDARGICGSGLVDAVAAGLETGLILPTGRLRNGEAMPLMGDVTLTQTDIRQLQLAKGAIAAGIRVLLAARGVDAGQLHTLYLAGAFGNYIRLASATRIGLLGLPEKLIHPSGNTALLGAKIALFAPDTAAVCRDVIGRTEHMSLSADPKFQDTYVDEMSFEMKIAFEGWELPEGKVKYRDPIVEALTAKFEPKKVSPYYFEFVRGDFEHADAIVIAAGSVLDLLIQDMEKIERRLERVEDEAERAILRRATESLEGETPLCDMVLTAEERAMVAAVMPLSLKPVLVLAEDAPDINAICRRVMEKAGRMFFYTAGKDEVHAWIVPCGADAVTCAGKIHTDLARGFIKAELVKYQDLMRTHSFQSARTEGLSRLVDRDYVIEPETVLEIRFNV